MIVNFDVFKGNKKMNDIFNSLKFNVEYSVGCSRLFALIKQSYDNEYDFYILKPVHYILGGTISYNELIFSVEIANVLDESGQISSFIISQVCTYEENGSINQDGNFNLNDTQDGYIERMLNMDELSLLKMIPEAYINDAQSMKFYKSKKKGSFYSSDWMNLSKRSK